MLDRQHLMSASITSLLRAFVFSVTIAENPSSQRYVEGTFDYKMTFEKHLRSVSRVASQWLGILRKSWQAFHDRLLLGRCFRCFVLPVLEYCSAVWCSAADQLRLLDRVVSGALDYWIA